MLNNNKYVGKTDYDAYKKNMKKDFENTFLSSLAASGKYKVNGDKIFMAEKGSDFDDIYDTFSISDDTLTFVSTNDTNYNPKGNNIFKYSVTFSMIKK